MQRTWIAAALFGAAAVQAADLPKEGSYDFTACWSGTSSMVAFSKTHWGLSYEMTGATLSNPPGGNQPPNFTADIGNAAEVTMTTSGGLGELETAGLTMNIVPKQGGNQLSGWRSCRVSRKGCSRTTSPRNCRRAVPRCRTRSTTSTTSTLQWAVPS